MTGCGTIRCATAAALLMLLMACSQGGDASGGKPWRVVVVAADEGMGRMVSSMLSRPMEGLPREEPTFDVTLISTPSTDLQQSIRGLRAIVVVEAAADHEGPTSLSYEMDAWARPQIIVRVATRSRKRLERDSAKVARSLTALLERFETREAIKALSLNRNEQAERLIDSTLGCKAIIGADMTSWKTGSDFLWLSDNRRGLMANICIYATDDMATNRLVTTRDSVMAANIEGYGPGMHPRVEQRAPVSLKTIRHGGHTATELRGLWQMEGDDMGGPFLSHTIRDTIRGRTLTIDAFLYGPDHDKRDRLRELEAMLFTLRTE